MTNTTTLEKTDTKKQESKRENSINNIHINEGKNLKENMVYLIESDSKLDQKLVRGLTS